MHIDLEKIKKVYVIGIKGSGVIGAVEILKARGIEVLGSDTEEKFFTDEILQKKRIKYFEKFSTENIPDDVDLVIYSTAYNETNNIEFQEALKRKLVMSSYPEMLAALFNEKYGIAICGTHGKTTTSAMLAHTLKEIRVDPSAIIGGRVMNWDGNALAGNGEFFVAEADEFQNKLRLYNPKAVVLTSLDWDHPDTYPNFFEYKKAFGDFIARIPKIGFLLTWGDSVDTLEVSREASCPVLTYGFSEECDYNIVSSELRKFNVTYHKKDLVEFGINLVGKHNLLNACAVVAVCHKLNLDLEEARKALNIFNGTKRRFEYVGERNGAILIDDYGHHPEEIKATLKGAREVYPDKNIWAVFHPHSYSRTEALLQEFSQSFDDANKVIVLDIYGSARENSGNVCSEDLVKLINRFDRNKAEHIKTIQEATSFLADKIGAEDVVITIGAGNVWEVASKLKEK